MTTKQRFLEAYKAALTNETVSWKTISNQGGTALFQLTKEQGVYPMIYSVVHNCKAMEPYTTQLQDVPVKTTEIVAQQIKKDADFLWVYRQLCSSNTKPLVVKGFMCRILYTQPCHRPSVDEDLLIRWKDFEACNDRLLVDEMDVIGTNGNTENPYEVLYWKHDSKLHIELHKELFAVDSETSGDFNRFFAKAHERAIEVEIQGQKIYTLCHMDHMLFLICYALKHFWGGGLGIRPVSDMMLFANAYGDSID